MVPCMLCRMTVIRHNTIRVQSYAAVGNSRKMVELKHELLTRRQKLRARMEYSVGSIHEMKGEALKNMSKLGNNAYQLEQIIRKIEAMNPVFK